MAKPAKRSKSNHKNAGANCTGAIKLKQARHAILSSDRMMAKVRQGDAEIVNIQLGLGVEPGFCIRGCGNRLSSEDKDGICMFCKEHLAHLAKLQEKAKAEREAETQAKNKKVTAAMQVMMRNAERGITATKSTPRAAGAEIGLFKEAEKAGKA